jgi:hypothetical protein
VANAIDLFRTRFDSKSYIEWLGVRQQPGKKPDGSGALIIVLDADDVVLAEIAPGLHLDQLQLDLAGVFAPIGM